MDRRTLAWLGIVVVGVGVVVWSMLSSHGGSPGAREPTPGLQVGVGSPPTRGAGGPIQPTVHVAELPASAEGLPPGDYGVEVGEGGSIRGAWPASGLRCESDGIVRVDTDHGTFLAGLTTPSAYPCRAVLDQWGRLAPSSVLLGVRYVAGDGVVQRGFVIVNEQGASLSLSVGGAWRLPQSRASSATQDRLHS